MRLWDVAIRDLLGIVESHADRVSAVAFAANGQLPASTPFDMAINLQDLVTENWGVHLELIHISFRNYCSRLIVCY